MKTFTGASANDVWLQAATEFQRGKPSAVPSRGGGTTLELRPVLFEITDSRQRWVIARQPALNPAAVLSEVIWILQGRNDSKFVNYWNNSLKEFAGSGPTYHGAYGFRLRQRFGVDQLERATDALAANPSSRQVCLSIWDPRADLPESEGTPRSTDIPCNTFSMLKVRDGRLEWTQVMRSNDFWLGFPFNVVQFTVLQEVIAGRLGVRTGHYHHLSDSLHLYPKHEAALHAVSGGSVSATGVDDFSTVGEAESTSMITEIASRMDVLVGKGTLAESDIIDATPPADWAAPYANLIRVVIADAARRSGLHDASADVMSNCSDPLLSDVWTNWVDRVTGDSSRS